jgi:hypothetical protein
MAWTPVIERPPRLTSSAFPQPGRNLGGCAIPLARLLRQTERRAQHPEIGAPPIHPLLFWVAGPISGNGGAAALSDRFSQPGHLIETGGTRSQN